LVNELIVASTYPFCSFLLKRYKTTVKSMFIYVKHDLYFAKSSLK